MAQIGHRLAELVAAVFAGNLLALLVFLDFPLAFFNNILVLFQLVNYVGQKVWVDVEFGQDVAEVNLVLLYLAGNLQRAAISSSLLMYSCWV